MSYIVEKQPDMPVMIVVMNADFDPSTESLPLRRQITAHLDAAHRPIYIVIIIQAHFTVNDLLAATHDVTRGEGAFTSHANTKQLLLVTDNPMLKLAAKGLQAASFGGLNVQTVPSLDDALAVVRNDTTKDRAS